MNKGLYLEKGYKSCELLWSVYVRDEEIGPFEVKDHISGHNAQ